MTRQQFRRWYGFAVRMARRGLNGGRPLPRKSIEFLEKVIRDFFRGILDDDRWYAEHRGKGMIERIQDWDNSDHDGIERGEFLYPVGDRVTILLEERNPHRYHGTDSQYDRWDEHWGARVRCCIRAGLDMASAPSAGVVGFTIGDLRRMYRGTLPAWLAADFTDSKTKRPMDLNDKKVRDAATVWL